MTIFIFLIFTSTIQPEMNYPYTASDERSELIRVQYMKIKIGDTEQMVVNLLTEPDEIFDLYEPKKHNPRVIGKTFWYIIQRMCKSCSANEKKEKLVRISFDLNGKVFEVTHWGF